MNIVQVFITILSTCALAFSIFQLWYYYENYDYIISYNNMFRNLQFSRTANNNFKDSTVYDPNDNVFDEPKKWRCSQNNGLYYAISSYGFMSDNNFEITRTYIHETDCIIEMFNTRIPIVYNPCIVLDSNDCILLNTLLTR